jgi:hypothetical protein
MKLSEDTHLAYTVAHEAWYWRGDENPFVMVAASAKGSGGGVAWEFQIEEMELGGKPTTRVKVFDDAYAAFAQIPEFFAAFADAPPSTLRAVIAALDAMGAVDETERISPHAEKIRRPRREHDATFREALRIAVTAAENDRQAERFEAALAAMDHED